MAGAAFLGVGSSSRSTYTTVQYGQKRIRNQARIYEKENEE
jgi:hypothetical protein